MRIPRVFSCVVYSKQQDTGNSARKNKKQKTVRKKSKFSEGKFYIPKYHTYNIHYICSTLSRKMLNRKHEYTQGVKNSATKQPSKYRTPNTIVCKKKKNKIK